MSEMLSLTGGSRGWRAPRASSRAWRRIIDGRDLIRLAERELMSPLDIEARRLVVAAEGVSVVTAISRAPRST